LLLFSRLKKEDPRRGNDKEKKSVNAQGCTFYGKNSGQRAGMHVLRKKLHILRATIFSASESDNVEEAFQSQFSPFIEHNRLITLYRNKRIREVFFQEDVVDLAMAKRLRIADYAVDRSLVCLEKDVFESLGHGIGVGKGEVLINDIVFKIGH